MKTTERLRRLHCVYSGNYPQTPATRGRKNYYSLRHQIRLLRRNHPKHYDVAWYAQSLGIEPYRADCTIRKCGFTQRELGRAEPIKGYTTIQIPGPVGVLP